jgi:hypothetical protein
VERYFQQIGNFRFYRLFGAAFALYGDGLVLLGIARAEYPHTFADSHSPYVHLWDRIRARVASQSNSGVDASEFEYVARIAAVVAGGEEALRRKPVLVGYGEARSPLCLDANMARILIEYVRRGLPQTLDTMPNAGFTAPVTAAGCLSLGIAETLGGLLLGYATDPDAVIGVDIIPSLVDMRSGLFSYASAARMPLLGARVQMISEFYGCPSGVHGGKTDSCTIGIQAGADCRITAKAVRTPPRHTIRADFIPNNLFIFHRMKHECPICLFGKGKKSKPLLS